MSPVGLGNDATMLRFDNYTRENVTFLAFRPL